MELPCLKELYARLHSQGLEIVCFDVLSQQKAAEKLIAEKELPFTFVQEGMANGPISMGDWKVAACPSNYLIDRSGRVVWYLLGYETGAEVEMERKITDLLK